MKPRFRIPPQIVRLLLVTAFIAATYAGARVVLTPDSFGRYGHYRGAALEETANRRPVFAGAKACDECHEDTSASLARDKHKLIACESCHGPSSAHVRDPEVATLKLGDHTCFRCHATDPARPAKHKQVTQLDHYPGDRCIECHFPHQPNKSP